MTQVGDREVQLEALTAGAELIVRRASEVEVDLEYLGVQPLFMETRAYTGPAGDWILAPAAEDPLVRRGQLAVPRDQRRALARLLAAGLDFPAIYVAHELPRGRLQVPGVHGGGDLAGPPRFHAIDPAASRRLLDPVPAPARAVAVADRLGGLAGGLLRLLGAAVPIGAATASVVGAAAMRLDPIVFGAWTVHGSTAPGAPAAWFLLARWAY